MNRQIKVWVRASAMRRLAKKDGYVVANATDFTPLDNEATVRATLTFDPPKQKKPARRKV